MRTHDPLLLLPTSPAANGSSSLWCAPRRKYFDTLTDDFGGVYTLCFKGGRQMAVSRRKWRRDGKNCLHCARWPTDGRLHSYRFRRTDNRGRVVYSRIRPTVTRIDGLTKRNQEPRASGNHPPPTNAFHDKHLLPGIGPRESRAGRALHYGSLYATNSAGKFGPPMASTMYCLPPAI